MTSATYLLFLVALGFTSALHTGAPEQACETMTPGHGVPPQTGTSPYRVKLSKNTSSGEPIEITLMAPSQGPKFRGFLVQVRQVGGSQPVGQFNPSSDTNAQAVNCGGSNTAMTHKDNNDKEQVKLEWTPPPGANGQYEVLVSFVQVQSTFWVKQTSNDAKITVSATTGRSGSGPDSQPGQGHSSSGQSNSSNNNSNISNINKPNNASGNSSQPPSEGGAASIISFGSAIAVIAATAMLSFYSASWSKVL